MTEITRQNFEAQFDEIAEAVDKATFIAFDAEYTCLALNNSLKPSLTDTAEKRYQKLRKNVTQSTVSQIGVSLFIPSVDKQNSYSVKTYNVYLFPQPFGPLDCKFVCQASSMAFLSYHTFDFNKFIHDGVPYLNKDQEEHLRALHRVGRVKHNCDAMMVGNDREQLLSNVLDCIRKWSFTAKVGESEKFDIPKEDQNQYVLLADLLERFRDLVCQIRDDKLIVTKSAEKEEIKRSFNEEFERLFRKQIGFSRIIRKISSSRKPIVGHNCLTDLLFIYEKFHRTLPDSYKEFKKELHKLFPIIFDTKTISFCLRKTMRDKTDLFNETCLADLYAMLSSNQGQFYVLYSPFVEHAVGFDHYVDKHHVHEAGYDAFLTGYVFIRMAHFVAAKDIKSSEIVPLKFHQQLRALKEYVNCMNIARASLRYVVIGGNDPPSHVPARFVVCSKADPPEPLFAKEIASHFVPFGSADVQMENSYRAIVAVSNQKRAKNVIQAFKHHKKYKVTAYASSSYLNRDNLMSMGFGISLLAATGSIIYLLLRPDDP